MRFLAWLLGLQTYGDPVPSNGADRGKCGTLVIQHNRNICELKKSRQALCATMVELTLIQKEAQVIIAENSNGEESLILVMQEMVEQRHSKFTAAKDSIKASTDGDSNGSTSTDSSE